jgi:hypothetical protein
MPLEPVDPCPTDRGWQHELVEHVQQLVGVDESSDIVVGAFAEDLLVDPGTIRSVSHVINDSGLTPPDMQRQLDSPVDASSRNKIEILRHGYGP